MREATVTGMKRRLAGLGLLLLATGCGRAAAPPSPTASGAATGAPTAAGPAATVSFADLDGLHADLARRRGRPVLVNFWATWCAPCVEEMPGLAALAREYAGRGPDFVGVSLDAWVTGEGEETRAKVLGALATAGVAYPNLIYRGDQDPIVNAFHLPGPIPYSVLYDRAGREVKAWAGPVPIDDLRRALTALPSG